MKSVARRMRTEARSGIVVIEEEEEVLERRCASGCMMYGFR